MPDEGPTTGHLYKLENWVNKHLEVVDFIGVGILTPELIEMPYKMTKRNRNAAAVAAAPAISLNIHHS